MSRIESIAKLESESINFQSLSSEEQNKRRKLLSDILGTIIDNSPKLDYTPKETGIIVSAAFELYFMGKIDRKEKHQR